jgi:uncharacterized protein
MMALRQHGDALLLDVYVQPGAKADRCVGMFDHRVKISLRARAINNQANRSLIEFIAKQLHLPKRSLCLTFGDKGRRKTVRLSNCPMELVEQWLLKFGVG